MMIRPLSDLHDNCNALTSHCDEFQEPVFLTEKGEGRYVLMRMEPYESRLNQLGTRAKMIEAEGDFYREAFYQLMEEYKKITQALRESAALHEKLLQAANQGQWQIND